MGSSIEKSKQSTLANYGSFDLETMDEDEKNLPSGGGNYFKPKEGKNVIRFLPPPPGKKPTMIYHRHWFQMGGERKAIICTKHQYNQQCPVCDQGARLRSSGNKMDLRKARAYQPQSHVYVNIVDMQNPEKGVQLWQMPPGVYKGIRAALDMAGVKSFADPVKGFNILFKRTGSGIDTEYSAYTVAREASEVPDWEQLLPTQMDLEAVESPPTDEEQDQAVDAEFEDKSGSDGPRKKRDRSGGRDQANREKEEEEDVQF